MVRQPCAHVAGVRVVADSGFACVAICFFGADRGDSGDRVSWLAYAYFQEIARFAIGCAVVAANPDPVCSCCAWLFFAAAYRHRQSARGAICRLLEFEILCRAAKFLYVPAASGMAGSLL